MKLEGPSDKDRREHREGKSLKERRRKKPLHDYGRWASQGQARTRLRADRGWEKALCVLAVSPASPTKNRAPDRKYFRGVMNPLDEVFCIAKHTNEHSPGVMHRVTNNDEHASIAISNHVMIKGLVPSCTPSSRSTRSSGTPPMSSPKPNCPKRLTRHYMLCFVGYQRGTRHTALLVSFCLQSARSDGPIVASTPSRLLRPANIAYGMSRKSNLVAPLTLVVLV
jgi:hypothetical protein